MSQEAEHKLKTGVQRLCAAGSNPSLIGSALMSIHDSDVLVRA